MNDLPIDSDHATGQNTVVWPPLAKAIAKASGQKALVCLPIGKAIKPWDPSDLFCSDLLSKFQPNIGKILVTGASGYIGRRLIPELLVRCYKVRVMVRKGSPGYSAFWSDVGMVMADALETGDLRTALKDIDTAGKSFDIGGPDILTYEMMLKILAGFLKKRVFFLHVPFSSIRRKSILILMLAISSLHFWQSYKGN